MTLHKLHGSTEDRQRSRQIMSDGGDESIPVFSRASLTLGGLLRNQPRRMSPPNQLADDHGDRGKQQQVEDISIPCDCGPPDRLTQ